jgi:hypothetical protein
MFASEGGIYCDDAIIPAAEEWELSERLRKRGIPVLMATRIIAAHNQPVTLKSISEQAIKHAMGCAEASVKFPSTLNLRGLRNIIEFNRPLAWGDPAKLIFKKSLMRACAGKLPRGILLQLVQVIEHKAPNSSLLIPLYRIVIGLHAFSGVRNGLKRFGNCIDGRRA